MNIIHAIPEKIGSILPTKDSMDIPKIARSVLAKKNTIPMDKPANPIFPDLYQVKLL